MAEEDDSLSLDNPPPIIDNDLVSQEVNKDATRFKLLIDGELYTALKKHLLMVGKGRRPDLPKVNALTNGIILQLYFLKEEAGVNYSMMLSWLQKLFPITTNHVTESRLCHRINALLALSIELTNDDFQSLLQQTHDFLNLPPVLLSLGIKDVDPTSYDKPPINDVTNEVVILLHKLMSREKKTDAVLRKWLIRLSSTCAKLSESKLRTSVARALKIHRQLVKRGNQLELKNFFDQFFITGNCPQPIVENDTIPERLKLVNKGVQVSFNCFTCGQHKMTLKEKDSIILMLQDKIKSLEKEKAILKNREKELVDNLELQKSQLFYKRNVMLKKANADLTSKVSTLQKELDSSRQEFFDQKEKHEGTKRKLKSEQTMKSNLKKLKKELVEQNETSMNALRVLSEPGMTNLKENHHNIYSDKVRQLYIALQGEANVASTQATKVVMLVAKHLFNTTLNANDLPCSRTCLNFMDEAHHVAKQQIAEKILQCDTFTFGSDGTSREKKHFMEHHVVLDDGSMLSLGYSEVPNDKAETLLEKSLDLFDELSDVHSHSNSDIDKNVIFKSILTKLRCLMSDRASNMKLFNKKMLEFKKDLIGEDAAIEFLHCNAHFLIALSDASEKAVKEIESSIGKLGRDSDAQFSKFASSDETAACRVIRLTANVLGPRGDEKNGCRQEWIAHCDDINSQSTFSSYRSNRFNNLFENAIALLYHLEECSRFINDRASNHNQLLKSLSLDYQDNKLMSVVTGLALFATYLTCPYWKLMNSSTPYGQFPMHVKSMKSALDRWSEESFLVTDLQDEIPVFGNEFRCISNVADNYFVKCDQTIAASTFRLVCKNSGTVLVRQLSDFIEGGVYGGVLPTDIQELLDSCPLTNLTGERLFGDLDYDMTKRRTASTFLRSTIVMCKHNNVSQYLETKGVNERRSIMLSGRKMGKVLKEKHKAATKRAREILKEKLVENERRKKEKEMQSIEKRAALLTDILDQGGVCYTKNDLDELMKQPNKMTNLKIQIRFHKYHLNASDLRLTGNFQTLYAGLCNHLNPHIEEQVDSDSDSA